MTTGDGTQTGYWSRLQAGYAFGTMLANPIIDWVDITPKLGITNLEATFAPSEDVGGETVGFSQKRAPTGGIELGMERRFSGALLRLWAYGAFSSGVTELDKKYRTTASRFGIDSYIKLFGIGDIKVALVGFGLYDKTTIVKKSTMVTEGDTSPDEFSYTNAYLGLGLTLAW